jgi:tyrosine-protein kinase Etk/Wzc
MTQLAKAGTQGHPPSVLDNLSLQQFFSLLNQGKWCIAGFMLLMIAGGAAYIQLAPPVYQSQALVQISEQSEGDRGDNAGNLLLKYNTSPIETEMDIVASRAVIAEAAGRLNLNIQVTPSYFPILGKLTARYAAHSGNVFIPPIADKHYVWGGEQVRIDRLQLPAGYLGQPLRLVVGRNGQYDLYDPTGKRLLAGQAGKPRIMALPGMAGQQAEVLVSAITAHPGAEFFVTEQPEAAVITDLQSRLKVTQKTSGSSTGIMQLALTGADPVQVAQTLNMVVKAYIRQNIERKQEETARILAFLNKQLPVVKASLDKAETALASYNSAHGGVDIPVESQAVTAQLQDVEKEILATRIQLIELEQNFGDRHPAVLTVKNKLQQLQLRKASLTRQASTLPASSQTIARLTRDVKVDTDLYMRMLNKEQELNTAKAGIVGNLHLIENAVPATAPINTPPFVILLFNAIAGMVLGVIFVTGRRLMANKLENLPALEQTLGLPVYACIPHSDEQYRMTVEALIQGRGHLPVLALQKPNDWALEQLRRLRTKVLHAMADCQNNVIAICSPTQGNGKSFVSVNLAHLCSFAEKRVLLIDADMRRAGVSAYFSCGKAAGLAEVLDEAAALQTVIQQTETPHLHFLPAGSPIASAADLLMGARLQQLLADVSGRYDLVILDTPPVLAATDSVILAPMVGLNLIVAHAGRSKVRLIEQAIKELGKQGKGRLGVVINDARLEGEEALYAY